MMRARAGGPGPGRRPGLRGRAARRPRGDGGRGRVQHRHDRVPGGPHRSLVQGPDRLHDLPPHRQHRREHWKTRSPSRPWAEGFVVREASPVAPLVAGDGDARRLPPGARDRRDPGDRHPRPHPPSPGPRGPGGRDRHRATSIRGRLVATAQASPGLVGRDLVKEVTCPAPYAWGESVWRLGEGFTCPRRPRASTWSPTTRGSSGTSSAS